MALKPNDDRVDNLLNYFEKNYISLDSKFQPSIWTEFSNSLMRTTNACESFHSILMACFIRHTQTFSNLLKY